MKDEQIKTLPMCSCGKWHITGMFRNVWVCGECMTKLMEKQRVKEAQETKIWLEEING